MRKWLIVLNVIIKIKLIGGWYGVHIGGCFFGESNV
jgi:Leu/Phe-tRNA-protein transferase